MGRTAHGGCRRAPGGGDKYQLWCVISIPQIRNHALHAVLVAEWQEGRRTVFPTEPDHDTRIFAGGYRVPESLGIGLGHVDVVGKAHHGDLFPFRQGLVLLNDLVETFRVGCLICLPGGMGVVVYLRARSSADVRIGQEGENSRAVHLSIDAAVVDIVEIDPAGLFIASDGLIHIGDNRPLSGEPMGVENIHVEAGVLSPLQQRLRVVASRELISRGEFGAVGEGEGIGQRRGAGQIGGNGEGISKPVFTVGLHPVYRLGLDELPGKTQWLDGAALGGQMPAGIWLNHTGSDCGHLTAGDGRIGGEGAGAVVSCEHTGPVQQKDVIVVGGGVIHVGQGRDRVDRSQFRCRQGGGKDMGQLPPGGGNGEV